MGWHDVRARFTLILICISALLPVIECVVKMTTIHSAAQTHMISTEGVQTSTISLLPIPHSQKQNDVKTTGISKMNSTKNSNTSSINQGQINATILNEQKLEILVLKKMPCIKTASDSDFCYYAIEPKGSTWKFKCENEVNLENCDPNILVEDIEEKQLMQNSSMCNPMTMDNCSSLSTENCSTVIDYLKIVIVDEQQTICDDCDLWFIKSLLAESITFGFLGILFVNNFIWVWCWTKRNRQEKLLIQPKSYKQEDFEIIYAWKNSHDASLRPIPKVKRPRRIREVPLYENISIHEIVSTV